jgi:hypothetical protein
MLTEIFALLLIACSSIIGLFGFFVGRCARKLPIIDDRMPWTMHRGQIPPTIENSRAAAVQPHWPDSPTGSY